MPSTPSHQERLKILSEVFSPSSPITTKSAFYGRYDQMNKVGNALYERGQHIAMFGERGVGKTSMANVAEENHADIYSIKITCTRDNTFEAIWEEVIKNLFYAIKYSDDQKNKGLLKHLQGILDDHDLDIQAIIFTFQKLKTQLLIIFDEFDVIQDDNTLTKFADIMKAFSDNLPLVTLMVVGIAENVEELIGEHASLERCICQIHIPRMNKQELQDLIDSGLFKLKISMDKEIKQDIIAFSQGFPHYAHLLTKYSVLSAMEKKYNAVVRNNFDAAINQAIENAYQSTRSSYQKAVHSNKEISLYESVVQACALVPEDEHGTFRASDLISLLQELTQKPVTLKTYIYHLSKLHLETRGSLLQRFSHNNQTRYRFRNPILKAYILLRLYQLGFLKNKNKRSRITAHQSISTHI